ncbi:PAB-dependent poly(A)-specific ribonuclease subunit 3 [Podochytrium sp. JEL0797]|nr:PAB-dependent poly(A)-specific ribonuclease subunit 3 [Podochytrium sp. JEL0797]
MHQSAKQCRNFLAHGVCQYENNGCEFSHHRDGSPLANTQQLHLSQAQPYTPSNASPDWKKGKLRFDSPEFKPSAVPHPFVPSALSSHVGYASYGQSFVPDSLEQAYPGYSDSRPHPNQNYEDNLALGFGGMGIANPNLEAVDPHVFPNQIHASPVAPSQPLQYHLYAPALPHVSNIAPHQKHIQHFFMDDKLRETLQRRSEAIRAVLDPNCATTPPVHFRRYDSDHLYFAAPEAQTLPSEVHVYHSLFPLDDQNDKHSKVFGFPTSVYKAVSSIDGKTYILRRIEGFRLLSDVAITSIEGWRRIKHASIVSVREAFTTKAFGDNSLVFVYDYHPLSITLSAKYFVNTNAPQQRSGKVTSVPEKSLWSYIVQISLALKTLHAAGLAARILEPSKILVTGKNRVRLNCCGIFDMINFDGGKNVVQFQQDDLVNFGRLLVSLACGSLAAVHNLPKSLEFISRQYSLDFKNVILLLLSKRSNYKSIDEVVSLILPRILAEMNSAYSANDGMEAEMMKELENGRFDLDPSWSETGDRYLLKLFRDHVFHQVDEFGNPVVDVGHVVQCLNKLDAGVDERIMLMSRDEQSCLIVSYRELKQCVETSFAMLSRQTVG